MSAPATGLPCPPPAVRILARLVRGLPVDVEAAGLSDSWRALIEIVGDVPPPDRAATLRAALAARPDAAALTAAIFDADPPAEDEGWSRPTAFADYALPPFPTDALPPWLAEFVAAEARASQTPPDLAGLLALAVLSTACAGRVVVRPWGDWHEPTNLYLMVVLPPGHRKSAVFASATRPIQEREADLSRRLAPDIARAEGLRRVAAQTLHKAQDAAARAGPDGRAARVAVVERLAAELAARTVPPRPRLVVDDCSPERLATLLHDQGGRIAVLSPEGGVFDLMAGRYSTTGAPNFEHFLKGHAGDPIVVDRVGRPSDLVARPAITIGLTVQPEVLRGLMARPGFHGRGLLARFLYALPPSPLGRRAIDPPPMPEAVRAAYHAAVTSLLARPPSPAPHILELSPPAAARLKRFAADVEPRLAEFGDLERLVDWASKLVGAVARLAALLHLARHADHPAPPHLPVEDDTLAAAVALGDYFTAHARAAYAAMGVDPAVDDARYLLRWIARTGRPTFTRRDLFEATKGRFRQVEALAPALVVLERHGYLRQRPTWRSGPGRRPSPTYDVNPLVHAGPTNEPPKLSNSANCANSASGGLTPDVVIHGRDGLIRAKDSYGNDPCPPRDLRR